MDAVDVAQGYFDAWNRRDADAIVATFAEGGTYSDPNVPEGLTGQAIADYAGGLFAAFPDLSFEIVSHAPAGDGTAAQWMMRGTNTGSLRGAPPTGSAVALPGSDFIAVEDGKIRSVQGYFDQGTMMRQLGLQVIVQPYSVGPVAFGNSVYMQPGNGKKPGAFSITALQVTSENDAEEVRNYSQQILQEMARMPGVISVLLASAGHRMLTVTAWEDTESPAQMYRGGTHSEAMNRFFGSDFTAGGVTSVWKPERINALWVRCESCGSMQDHDLSNGMCQCGQPLPEPPPYW
ncbi:hypothetical protein BH18ACT10_BH18ACT10_04100 [soil metagenome]|nr:ester cyclase [Rubrobacter sp.]